MMCGEDRSSLQFEWYDHSGDGEWTWLDSIIPCSWVLLLKLLGTDFTLLPYFFFAFMLDNPTWVPATLVPSESIKEIHPEVAHDGGEAAELFVALLPVHLLQQHLFQLLKTDQSPNYLEKVTD